MAVGRPRKSRRPGRPRKRKSKGRPRKRKSKGRPRKRKSKGRPRKSRKPGRPRKSRKGGKRKSKGRPARKRKSKKGKAKRRDFPPYPASEYIGSEMMGNDGYMYEGKRYRSGASRWVKLPADQQPTNPKRWDRKFIRTDY